MLSRLALLRDDIRNKNWKEVGSMGKPCKYGKREVPVKVKASSKVLK